MEHDKLTLDAIKGTGYRTWLTFYEKFKGSSQRPNETEVEYIDQKGEKQKITLPLSLDLQDVEQLAYYEVLDHFKRLGINSLKDALKEIEKSGSSNQDQYQLRFITKNKDGMAYRYISILRETLDRLSALEQKNLVKYYESKLSTEGGSSGRNE